MALPACMAVPGGLTNACLFAGALNRYEPSYCYVLELASAAGSKHHFMPIKHHHICTSRPADFNGLIPEHSRRVLPHESK